MLTIRLSRIGKKKAFYRVGVIEVVKSGSLGIGGEAFSLKDVRAIQSRK